MTGQAVAYYRVSTVQQGRSGLGLEAQRATVQALAQQRSLQLVAEFQEVERASRTRRRPQLAAALEHCRRTGAVLLIARLDRLARSVSVISSLMDSGVQFLACDMPHADRLTLHVTAAVAEQEARLISERTRAAMAARRARGLPVGDVRNLPPGAAAAGGDVMRQAALQAMRPAATYAARLRADGLSLRQIAGALTEGGFQTRQGGAWDATQVRRILLRQAASTADTDNNAA
ncbi:recombinase family protein [Deinococcus sp. RIT780]|uniref:recombinase family protein n=1 Tax=Deinococcus sp. RIT780 TaxID=2870472 RepID=UPI001C8AF165|nr:recombinase family protein [Deinococcus sp. RIT780]MBX8466589.1 recombinase family protein [Deinococcus sp. RIT780]